MPYVHLSPYLESAHETNGSKGRSNFQTDIKAAGESESLFSFHFVLNGAWLCLPHRILHSAHGPADASCFEDVVVKIKFAKLFTRTCPFPKWMMTMATILPHGILLALMSSCSCHLFCSPKQRQRTASFRTHNGLPCRTRQSGRSDYWHWRSCRSGRVCYRHRHHRHRLLKSTP